MEARAGMARNPERTQSTAEAAVARTGVARRHGRARRARSPDWRSSAASPDDDALRRAHGVLAEAVIAHDERYWPLFEILDEELRKREARKKALAARFSHDDIMDLRARRRRRRTARPGPGGRSS